MPEEIPHFIQPEVENNLFGWGPCEILDQFKDMPYQPFSKGNHIEKVTPPKELLLANVNDQNIRNVDFIKDSLIKTNEGLPTSKQTKVAENNHPITTKINKTKLQEISSTIKQLKKLTKVLNTEPQENEFQIFGKHVATQLEKLSSINALLAQEKIQSLLTQLRVQEISPSETIWQFDYNINKKMDCSTTPSSLLSNSTNYSSNNYEST